MTEAVVVPYNPDWPRRFEAEAKLLERALGPWLFGGVHHVGSTAVPGLAAKPRIDVLLVVADSAHEPAYVPALEAAGYVLSVREPDWYEHRVFKGPDTDVNLHVFSPGCPEIARMLLFRDWVRRDPADRQLYERTKRELARQNWKYTQNYADAKTEVVEEILARAGRRCARERLAAGRSGAARQRMVTVLPQIVAEALCQTFRRRRNPFPVTPRRRP